MERKYIKKVLFALALMLLLPSMEAETKTKLKLEAKNKKVTVGKIYQMKLKGVSGKVKVKWKTSNKSVVLIAKRKGNMVTFKSKKKGTAVVTAVYKQKKCKC